MRLPGHALIARPTVRADHLCSILFISVEMLHTDPITFSGVVKSPDAAMPPDVFPLTRHRVALLTNIPAPYRLEFFRLLGERHELRVFFDRLSEPNRSWLTTRELPFRYALLKSYMVPYERMPTNSAVGEKRFRQLPYDLLFALRRFRPEIIISAELGFRTIQASLYAATHKIPLIIWWEGTQHTEAWAGRCRKLLRRCLVRRGHRYWSNGDESSKLLQSYGAARHRIDNGMTGTDTRRLWKETQTAMKTRDRFRSELGVSGTVFLYASRLVRPKGLFEYLKALECVRAATRSSVSAVFVGDGPERPSLERWKQSHPDINVSILGFQQPSQLPAIYAACDVFVLPTLDDNWSLASLEAATVGMPQILSIYNGGSVDLLSYGAPGICIDPYDTHTFASALKGYVENTPQRVNDNHRKQIEQFYSSETVALRACESISAALQVNPLR